MQATEMVNNDPNAVTGIENPADTPEGELPEPLTADEIREQVVERFQLALSESRDERERWNKGWLAYQNDWSDLMDGKDDWMSQVTLPVIATAVDFAAATIKNAVQPNRDDFFTTRPATRMGSYAADIKKRLILENLEREHFSAKIGTNVKAGLLTPGPCFKVLPAPDKRPWSGYARIDPVDFRYYFRDPSGLSTFEVQLVPIDRADLTRLSAKMGYDPAALDDVKDESGTPDVETFTRETARVTGFRQVDSRRKIVWLLDYWGPLHDKEGNEVYRFTNVVIGNKTATLQMPRTDDPFQDGLSPYIAGDIVEEPFSVYSRTYVDTALDPAEALIDLFNATLDGIKFAVGKAWEVDPNRLTPRGRKTVEEEGVSPGVVFEKIGDDKAFQHLDTGGFPQEALYLFQLIKQELQAATSVTSIVQGLPDARGSKENTLGEVNLKAQNASRALSALAERIEIGTIEPLLARMERYISLYTDLNDPVVQALCEPEISEALNRIAMDEMAKFQPNPELLMLAQSGDPQAGEVLMEQQQIAQQEAMQNAPMILAAAMKEPLGVMVRSVSGVLEREQEMNRFAGFAQTIATLGPAALSYLHPQRTVLWLANHQGIDTDILMTPEEMQAAQAQQMAAAAQQAEADEQAGNGEGPHAAAADEKRLQDGQGSQNGQNGPNGSNGSNGPGGRG